MATNYPTGLDDFTNPTNVPLGTAVGGRTHSEQHTDLNDAVEAIETRLGVSGSNVPGTIDFEIHDTTDGHNHDGVDSAQAVIGPPESGSSYVSGAISFTPTSYVGLAIDRINRMLSGSVRADVNGDVTISGSLLVSGSTVVSGTLTSFEGISGSLQTLSDGTPYLVGSGSINVSTGSNGQLTISYDECRMIAMSIAL